MFQDAGQGDGLLAGQWVLFAKKSHRTVGEERLHGQHVAILRHLCGQGPLIKKEGRNAHGGWIFGQSLK